MRTIFTIGHSTHTLEDFVALLHSAGVTRVVDVRRLPGSARFPQFNEDSLHLALAKRDISYVRIEALGGRRGKQRDTPQELNAFWRNQSFHNYADYALTDPYQDGLKELLALSEKEQVAIMCSEAVWWRCHRRIIADHLIALGCDVRNIMPNGRTEPASLTPGAITNKRMVTYPA